MNEYIISEYIKKLTVNDIIKLANKNNIEMNESDAIVLYSYAKKYYQDFLHGNSDKVIKEIRDKINPSTYKKLYKLYIKYKVKYINKNN